MIPFHRLLYWSSLSMTLDLLAQQLLRIPYSCAGTFYQS